VAKLIDVENQDTVKLQISKQCSIVNNKGVK